MKNFTEINFLDIEENKEYVQIINQVINLAFKEEKLDKTYMYINFVLTTPKNIREINKKYRNIDKETDVLSFPMFEKNEIEKILKEGKEIIPEALGDIIISIERVKEQAEEFGHGFERELAYMTTHGFYHLIGYDHIKEEDKVVMRKKEESLLEKLNITR